MKKLLAVFLILAFAAVPAMADDTLDASGSMRVEAYSISNSGFSDSDTADQDYWDQRFRLQLKFQPADGVKAVLRADFTEEAWGRYSNRPGLYSGYDYNKLNGLVLDPPSSASAARGAVEGGSHSIMMVDRAYLSVDKGMFNVTGGLNVWVLGGGIAYDNQGTGIQVTVKTPLTITLGMSKESENGWLADTKDTEDLAAPFAEDSQDTDNYWLNLGYATDMMALNVYYATQMDGRDGDRAEPNVIGAQVITTLGPLDVSGELMLFGGSDANDDDYFGTQFFGDVAFKMSDMVTLGSHLIFATGTDDDDEDQLTTINDFTDYVIQDKILPQNGPGSLQPFGNANLFDVGRGNNQGSMGIGPYAKIKVMDNLAVHAHVIWATSAAEGASEEAEIDSILFYGIGASWAFADNTKLDFGYTAGTINEGSDNDRDYEDYGAFGAVLSVSF